MSELLHRFSFATANWNGQILACVLILWLLIVGCAISSIRAQGFSHGQRRFWIGIVLLMPVIGLLAYLPFSVRQEDSPVRVTLRPRKQRRPETPSEPKKTPGRA
jgi:hypothetical protein